MEFLWFFLAGMLFLLIKGTYDKKKAKERLVLSLKNNWGVLPEEEYSEAKFKSLQYYYEHKVKNRGKEKVFHLDEITWNDLSLNELFFMMNHTCCAMGEEVLWSLLHEVQLTETPLLEREQLISFFQEKEDVRLNLQTSLALIGKDKRISVYEYMDRIDGVRRESNLLHFLGNAGIALSVLLLFWSGWLGGVLLLVFMVFNLLTYYKRKGEIESYYSVITYLLRMLSYTEQIAKEDIPELHKYLGQLKHHVTALKAFRKGAPAVLPQNPTGDVFSFFLDYIRILFHTDLICFNRMMKQYFNKKEYIVEIFEIIGFIDAMCAVASFRTWLNGYCLPEFTENKQYHAEEMYHPFLEHPVPASIRTEQSVLITGSNASGKSTFIKAVAMNAILSQTIHTVCAKSYRSGFFKILTSMALTDNLFGNESYYIVEIKSLKRILDEIEKEIPVLCFVDEVLRGTNTVERIAASSRILHSISCSNALMFAATHDIELTYMLEECFSNYHFTEQIAEDNVLFDYELKTGRATSQNAIALLGMLGYPKHIIAKARDTAAHFVDCGEWKKIEPETN